MRWLIIILRIATGLLFIFSGLLKLYPIEPFEFNFVHIGVANWTFAPFFARGIIAVELILGLALVFNPHKRSTIFGGLALLSLFTVYLFIALLTEGNQDNCGCFGTYLQMSTTTSIIKNIAIIGSLLLLLKKARSWQWPHRWIVTVAIIASGIATPFILNPVKLDAAVHSASDQLPVRAPLEYLPDMDFNGKTVDLEKGEKLLAMFSLDCPHCKHLAMKLSIISKQADIPGVYVIFIGDEQKLDGFLTKTNMPFPYKIFNDKHYFRISGPKLPALLYLKNGMVHHYWTGEDVPPSEILNLARNR